MDNIINNVNVLIVIDMQNDFIDGALGTDEAVKIVSKVEEKIRKWEGLVLFTKDTHNSDYLDTQEGKKLPVPHCIKGTKGWELNDKLLKYEKCDNVVEKPTFGSIALADYLYEISDKKGINSITLVGLCTDICVISNALLLKAMLPEVPILVDAACCAGVTVESHENALKSMEVCQIGIVR